VRKLKRFVQETKPLKSRPPAHNDLRYTSTDQSPRVQSLESQIADLESESSRLSRSLEAQKALVSETESRSSKRLKDLSDDVARRESEIQSLKTKLERMSDYDEIKRELAIVKYVEFSGMGGLDGEDEEDEWEGESELLSLPSPNAAKAVSQKNKSLEALLASKNKRIQEELTKFRVCLFLSE
jgi:homeobox protein cut-like